MGILKYIICLAASTTLVGCYTDFEPKIDSTPVLCLNCIITAGEPIEPEVTRTWLYSDAQGAQNNAVDDAVVSIFANGELVGKDYIPRCGDNIRILAQSEKYGRAEGQTTVPQRVDVGAVECSPTIKLCRRWVYDDFSYNVIDFSFDLRIEVPDPIDSQNYYHYQLNNYTNHLYSPDVDEPQPITVGYVAGGMSLDYEPIFTEHISSFESIIGSGSYGFTFFTDRQFNGRSYTLNLKYPEATASMTVMDSYANPSFDGGFIVKLSSLSPEFYTWLNYSWQVYDGILGYLEEVGLGNPVPGYSNVSTHAGIVASRSVSEYKINLSEVMDSTLKDFLDSDLSAHND